MSHADIVERPLPPGIILENYTEDAEIGLLKSGKEADVFLVERSGPAGSCLLAAKRYRPAEQRGFRNDAAYRSDRRIDGLVRDGARRRRPKGGRGVQLAMDKRTEFGRSVLAKSWIQAEWDSLDALWQAGVPVPYPVAHLDDGILMEYVGDAEQAAPRLVDARVPAAALPPLYEQLRAAMRSIVEAGLVHADLSPYNTLVWHDRLWIIDVPQTVGLLTNEDAMDFLHRDVFNMVAWFNRRGLDLDPEDLFVELVNLAFEVRMEDLFRAR
jgi:RIO kinase 1